MNLLAKFVIAGVLGSAALVASAGTNDNGNTKGAKLTMTEARAIALKTFPGKIVKEELEKEKGGSGLRYSFDIVAGDKTTHEVGVDAKNGEILENGVEKD